MPALKTFTYEALDHTGAVVKGKIESDSPDGAARSRFGSQRRHLRATPATPPSRRRSWSRAWGSRCSRSAIAPR